MRITSKLTTPFFSPCAFTIHKIASIELQKWKTNSTNVELLHVDMYICSVSFTKITEYQHDHSVVASTWLFCGWWHLLFSSVFLSFHVSGAGEGSMLKGRSSLIPPVLRKWDWKISLPVLSPNLSKAATPRFNLFC